MTERGIVYAVALLVVAMMAVGMMAAHERHYKNRRWQMLEARVNVLEKIVAGEHD